MSLRIFLVMVTSVDPQRYVELAVTGKFIYWNNTGQILMNCSPAEASVFTDEDCIEKLRKDFPITLTGVELELVEFMQL